MAFFMGFSGFYLVLYHFRSSKELCSDLQISALDPVTLVLAWHCRAKQRLGLGRAVSHASRGFFMSVSCFFHGFSMVSNGFSVFFHGF